MKTNYRKITKLVTLLFTSLLVSYASAATYSELFIRGPTVRIGVAGVRFVNGDDTGTLDGTINDAGTEVTFGTITIEPGQALAYDEAVNITNNAGSTKLVTLTLESLTGSFEGNFEFINFTVIAKNGTKLGSIKVFPEGGGQDIQEVGPLSMPNGETWAIQWSVKASLNAQENASITVVIKIRVE